jgi:hypothetical protein
MDRRKVVGATGFEPATPCAQGPRPAIIRSFLQQRTSKSLIHRWIGRCVDHAASLLVIEFVQHGTNERTQLGSRHRLEGPAEIRVSRSNTGLAKPPTDHYSVPCDTSDSRASCTSVLGIRSWLATGLDPRSSLRAGWMPPAARLSLLAFTFAASRSYPH